MKKAKNQQGEIESDKVEYFKSLHSKEENTPQK